MKMLSENKRFLILIAIIGITVLAVSMAARFLGSILWGQEPGTETVFSLPADEPGSPSVPSSRVARPAESPLPKTPVSSTIEGKASPKFQALGEQLATMEQALSNHSEGRQELNKKMLEADALISRAEGIIRGSDIPLSAPSSLPLESKEHNKGKDTNIEHLRERLEALKSRP
uniref:Uncharacterized protein n=1 Tax=Candidatus Kentrum sp. TC TaxID=2126339 RepID=A0A451A7R4_9GAMM|nr:MAG: hypothetical protein BECKTC1821F_GA0114240_106814 [Candidatus Kentron sp. TC]